jgi:hypothetical protein
VGTNTSTSTNTEIKLKWLVWANPPVAGSSLLVLNGSGVGQLRRIVGVGADNGTLVLDAPLDSWVIPYTPPMVGTGTLAHTLAEVASDTSGTRSAPQPSIVAVIPSFGSKLFLGNRFNWTEVVQWYGNTYKGVIADNHFSNCNTKPGGNVGANSLGARGPVRVFRHDFALEDVIGSQAYSLFKRTCV